MFSKSFAKYRDVLQDDYVGLFRATVDKSRDEPTLLVDDVVDISQPEVASNRRLLLDLEDTRQDVLWKVASDEGVPQLTPGLILAASKV